MLGLFRKAGDRFEDSELAHELATVEKYGPYTDEMVDTGLLPRQRATLDTISKAEGTWNDDTQAPDYTQRFSERPGAGSLDTSKPHPRTKLGSSYGSGYRSNASGAYQFLDSSWQDQNDGINAPMTPDNQDRAALGLIESTGYDTNKPFAGQSHKLAPKWASIPNESGLSAYNQPVKSADDLGGFYGERLGLLEDERRNEVYERRGDQGFEFAKKSLGGDTRMAGEAVTGLIGPPAPTAERQPWQWADIPSGAPKFGDTNVISGKRYAGKNWGWQSEGSFQKVAPLYSTFDPASINPAATPPASNPVSVPAIEPIAAPPPIPGPPPQIEAPNNFFQGLFNNLF